MEDNKEKNETVTSTSEELKNEATNTVNQVKETIKKVDIKKDSIETKGFLGEFFKDPLGKMKEIVSKDSNKYFTFAIIILVVWTAAVVLKTCFSFGGWYGFKYFGQSILKVIKAFITPALSILVMSLIVFLFNKNNKKSLTTVITTFVVAKIPTVIAAIVSLITIFSLKALSITNPFTSFCYVCSIVLEFFAMKSIMVTEKNSEFIKTFVKIEAVYYVVYFVLSFLELYI